MKGLKLAWAGRTIWKRLKRRYHIDYSKVVIALPEGDVQWNQYALLHLKDYMDRKSAGAAIILCPSEEIEEEIRPYCQTNYTIVRECKADMIKLNQYYCFFRFFDNIVFFSLGFPKDNISGEIIENGIITKEELICLGFYHLRSVPPLLGG